VGHDPAVYVEFSSVPINFL